ncbi:FliM/FliN family flagellar motor switch protein [Limoniibacter endophyticus]|uniref:Flagellar motor switch protein FliM n=1 Tax=Limoniibacter endophyticus TaxID=1565040 RepID=A0A8J3GFS4_9HYPH|nr:FliM/FliN family flagellar motor switch protein [Limoniibacter endophyticus]GHC64636.1 flagellar motor switch protein FliM [Limoniibacter endophyticus]
MTRKQDNAIAPRSEAEKRALIIERLIGDTGEPGQIVRAARKMGERVLPSVSKTLAELLPAPVEIEISAVEVTRFSEALRGLSQSSALLIAASSSSPDALVMHLEAQGVAILVNALFGGAVDDEVEVHDKALSPTELDVASLIFKPFAEALNGSGKRALDLKMPLPEPINGQGLKKQSLRDGPAVHLALTLTLGANSGVLHLYMPQRVFLQHRGNAIADEAGNEPKEDWSEKFSGEIKRSKVSMEAQIMLGRLTLAQIADFHAGQVLPLDIGAMESVLLKAGSSKLFSCEFGKLGDQYTVRVREPFDAERDLMNEILTQD